MHVYARRTFLWELITASHAGYVRYVRAAGCNVDVVRPAPFPALLPFRDRSSIELSHMSPPKCRHMLLLLVLPERQCPHHPRRRDGTPTLPLPACFTPTRCLASGLLAVVLQLSYCH